LKICHRDSKRGKNNFAEKNKSNRDTEAGYDSEKRLSYSIFPLGSRTEADEQRDEADRITRDKERNEGEQKSLSKPSHELAFRMSHSIAQNITPTMALAISALPICARYTMFVPSPRSVKHLFISLLLFGLGLPLPAGELKSVGDFRAAAEKSNEVLTIPDWPQTPEAVGAAMKDAIAKGNAALDEIGKQDFSKVTFKTTVVALDDLTYEAGNAGNKAVIIKETNTSPAMRTAAENAVKAYQDWGVGIDYREDVYKAIKAFADTHPKLTGEDEKLFNETLRDYRRAGLDLPPEKRQNVEKLRKELSKMETDFSSNIVAAKVPLVFTKAELEGVPESILNSPGVKTGDDSYTILANVTFQYNGVMQTARREETRKRLNVTRTNLAREKNVLLLNSILTTRNQVALCLGYKSWDDFQTEIRMAKTGAQAKQFINDLIAGTQPKFDQEIAEMRKIKIAETKNQNAQIMRWDWRYFSDQVKKQKYTVDTEALRAYFPFQQTLEGMFNIYQSIFGLKFYRIRVPYKWIDDLQLYLVADAASGQPLGMFYLDMFPRDGKFNHFAEFDIIGGKL